MAVQNLGFNQQPQKQTKTTVDPRSNFEVIDDDADSDKPNTEDEEQQVTKLLK